ncbi:MAG: hypothetical protein GY796_22890 [Chloroflexi bacterium]|nr:hypothetical protein [Chloroflexota bacterium]
MNMQMNKERPDISGVSPEIQHYIIALETEIERLQEAALQTAVSTRSTGRTTTEPAEPPTTLNVISVSRRGFAKRTPRHFYGRQRRGGIGVFDLDVAEPDYPAHLTIADETDTLLLISNLGRAFRVPVSNLSEASLRALGEWLLAGLLIRENEQIVTVLPAAVSRFLIMVSQRGWVQRIRASFVGTSLIPGMTFHDVKQGGHVTAACWTPGDGELFLATKQGRAIRFLESQVPDRGCLGLRVELGDEVAAVTAVTEESGVFLLSQNGKGTVRLMSGFRRNKAPGAGGKVALKTDRLAAAAAVQSGDDIFIIAKSGKIIRFQVDEIPTKEGVVQGVNCMALRNDMVTAVTQSQ